MRRVRPSGRTSRTGPRALMVLTTGAVGDMGGGALAHPAPTSVATRAKAPPRRKLMRRSLAQGRSDGDAGARDRGGRVGREVRDDIGHRVRADPRRLVG